MWIRDSAVQMGVHLSRVRQHPALRRLVEGTLRSQAFFITQDPYANAFYYNWTDRKSLDQEGRLLGRGGWVATRNYEQVRKLRKMRINGPYTLHSVALCSRKSATGLQPRTTNAATW